MEFFRIQRDIPFMRHALVFNIISFLTFAAAVFFLATRGLHLSIEFTGGTVLEVSYTQAADINKARASVETLGFGEVQVQNFGTSHDVLIRLPVRGDLKQSDVAARVFERLCTDEGGRLVARQYTTPQGEQVSRTACAGTGDVEPIRLSRTEFVGPAVGAELYADGLKALAFVVIGIMVYLAFRFEWKFSIAAIVANLHDVVIILGFFAYFQWEFSLAVLAAVLAVRGGRAEPEAPFVIEHREALIYMLYEAAELEHGIMLQYLFAVFSLWLFRLTTPGSEKSPDKKRRDAFYALCGIVIVVCMVWARLAHVAHRSIFWPETIALVSFALSWLVKGASHRDDRGEATQRGVRESF